MACKKLLGKLRAQANAAEISVINPDISSLLKYLVFSCDKKVLGTLAVVGGTPVWGGGVM